MNQPKPNKLIKCKGHDWSDFECVGMWVMYKPSGTKKFRGKGRFMMQDEFGNWNAATDTWKAEILAVRPTFMQRYMQEKEK